MSKSDSWQIQPSTQLPDWLLPAIQPYLPDLDLPTAGQHAAQLLWQRGIRQPQQLTGFLDPANYQPASAFAFPEMTMAVNRLCQSIETAEKVAIWGDFDADGVTATAVLWEGLSQFLPQQQLTYYIPNRLTESHGLSQSGIQTLAAQGYSLIVTCDTGSTNLAEIQTAQALGIDVIITDHHTLPPERPPVSAILNPRSLPIDHPLATLSGVAVAYKLIEALYEAISDQAIPDQTIPASNQPRQPLTNLLDLVAIGLIADLVNLTGDCRYLAQIGIKQLQKNQDPNPPRPGIAKLLELCRRNGDRPTDISFGLGPRINAISRIQGDARFCVELLTSRNRDRCQQLALETELANARRKALQRDVVQQVKQKLAQIDLSTTEVIVLADPQWSVGILGLVAGQIAQEYQRPTILLSTEQPSTEQPSTEQFTEFNPELNPELSSELFNFSPTDSSGIDLSDRAIRSESLTSNQTIPPTNSLAKGSARSVRQIDLYDLLEKQSSLLHRFGGHPFAAGLSLPIENIPLFTEAINQQVRSTASHSGQHPVQADLVVTVSELGRSLFQALKLLEPYGMGNPVPKLWIQNCWFTKPWHRKIQDLTGRKLEYLKTEFLICDETCPAGFPGVWWGHYKDELPIGRGHALVELDFNSYEDHRRKKRYEVRLLAVQQEVAAAPIAPTDWIVDWRNPDLATDQASLDQAVLPISICPSSWEELQAWAHQAKQRHQKLALAYAAPSNLDPIERWQQLVGIAKHLSRTGKTVTRQQLREKLQIGDRSLQLGLNLLQQIGFQITATRSDLSIRPPADSPDLQPQNASNSISIATFTALVREEQFMQQYFYQVPLPILQEGVALNSWN